jgi:hypothetical protein
VQYRRKRVRAGLALFALRKKNGYGLRREKRFSLETSLTMIIAKNKISMTKAT